jgi:uncharacterized protein (DUF1778 family)
MAAKVNKRIEVRLDEKHRQMLERILACRDTTVSEFLREEIEKADREVRLEQFEELLAWARENPIDVPDDPDELNRELDDTHNPLLDDPELKKAWLGED